MSNDVNEKNRAWCKGLIGSYVARGHDRPDRIAKCLATTMAKGELDGASLKAILATINNETVQPFLGRVGSVFHQPERLERFHLVRKTIDQVLSGC